MKRVTLITGPIASGKSETCRYLSSLGYPVYDCDSRVKALYASREGLVERIEDELGIAFSQLRQIFSNGALREKLEAIVYPILLDDMRTWIDSQSHTHVFVESAIALEKRQFDGVYGDVLMITADRSLRLGRNIAVSQRDALQHFDESAAGYIIHNNTTIEHLHSEIDKYLIEYENRSC